MRSLFVSATPQSSSHLPSRRSTVVLLSIIGAAVAAYVCDVTDPEQIGPALDRAYASGVPYLVNIITDPAAFYPRTTTGI